MADGSEPNLGGGGLGGGGAMRDVRTRFSVDNSQMEKLVKGFSSIKSDIKWMHDNLDKTIAKVNQLAASLQKVQAGQARTSSVSNPSNTTSNAVSAAIQASQNQISGSATAPASAVANATPAAPAAGGGGFFKNFRGAMGTPAFGAGQAIGGAISSAVGRTIGLIDARTDAGYAHALSADRLGLLYQQTMGITQNQYANQLRMPLANGLLGAGGVSTLLALQAQTGLNAQTMRPGVEALRAASGFSLTTQDMSQLIRTLASPAVNNRMTMTLGTGIYGVGGAQRNPMQVTQQIVRGMGLTNERVVNSGMQQGSITRARLTSMGVPEDMQDLVLQYAQENIQYQKRGGKGMYDPSDPAQRQRMGIARNFAMEREITDTRRAERDERFYKRQADNYAALERNTQRLIDVFSALEDKLSGIIGARISTRNNPAGGLLRRIGGLGLTGLGFAIGAGMTPFTGGASLIAGGALASAGMALATGDGSATAKKSTSGVKVPVSYSDKKVPIADLEKIPSFSKLNPKFKERLIKMMMDNPNVGVGQGYRSAGDQRSMFLSRYTRTTEDTGTYWDGSFWKKNPNVADAAPPGLSMHEIGLAADLVGDLDWVQKNAAKYGLQTFANVNNEPWHVQPAELPRGRSEYEKKGAPWGTTTGGNKFDPNSIFNGVVGGGIITDSGMGSIASPSRSVQSMSQMSLADQIKAIKEENKDIMGRGGGGAVVSAMSASGGVPSVATTASTKPKRVGLKARQGKWGVYHIPDRPFTRADWDAIAQVETKKNWQFVNGSKVFRGGLAMHKDVWRYYGGEDFAKFANKATPDQQIEIANRSSFEGYNDPKTGQFKAAVGIGGFESVAKNAISWPNVMKGGDGSPTAMPMRNTMRTVVQGGSTITIAPNIYIQSTGNNTADAHRAAKETARIFVEETKLALMRNM